MAHIQFGTSVSLSFASPNEMVEILGSVIDDEAFFLAGDGPKDATTEFDVQILVPWIGRRMMLRGHVQGFEVREAERGALIYLIDGASDTVEQLQGLMIRIKTGAILESQPGDPPAEQRIRAMNPTLRSMLASKADQEERKILADDNDPKVVDLLLQNPRLTISEVRHIASRRTLQAKHFRTLMRNMRWMSDETVKTNIILNPRLPEFMAQVAMLTMTTPFLLQVTRSINATTSTKRQAVKILKKRGVQVSMRIEGL